MAVDTLADFFMPEDRKRGDDLFAKELVSIASASDTQVRAFIKASGAPRVSFTAADITSPGFQADCTCPSAKKGRLCKHIWATLLKLDAKGSDFLASKIAIEKGSAQMASPVNLAAKVRQAEYKQQRSEQNKARNKDRRRGKKQSAAAAAFSYPDEVEAARAYFATNGFELTHPLALEPLDAARKLLARVFHPDKGGTHSEILTLNENYDIIAAYLGA